MRDVLHLVDSAVTAAEAAGRYLRSAIPPTTETWSEKGPRDFVTAVDRSAEQLIREHLLDAVPGSRVMGEELSPTEAATSGLTWIVDPLDGTVNFLHGYPQYAVSIAALLEGDPVAGVVVDAPRGITYRAWRDGGAWANDRRIQVSSIEEMSLSLIGTGLPFKRLDVLPDYQRQLAAVLHACAGVRRAGSAALDLVDVAAGRFEGFWELDLAPWDIAGGVVLVREAGGIITSLEGPLQLDRQQSVVAGNPAVYESLLRLLNETT